MNKPKFIFLAVVFCLFSSINSFAQTENKQPQAEPCYEIVLQLLIASNGAGEKITVPPSLANVVKKLKTLYTFSDYRLATTFLQRTANSVEYRSLLNDFSQNQDKNTPTFSEWSLRGLRNLPNAQGRNTLQVESLRFGARVPVTVANLKDESGKTSSVVNYESIGITTVRFGLSENEPTVVGSLAMPKPDEFMFLILTVRPTE